MDMRHRLRQGAYAVDDLVEPPLVPTDEAELGGERVARVRLAAGGADLEGSERLRLGVRRPACRGERRASLRGKPGVERLAQLRRESFTGTPKQSPFSQLTSPTLTPTLTASACSGVRRL